MTRRRPRFLRPLPLPLHLPLKQGGIISIMKTSIIICLSALATLCAAQFGLPDCAVSVLDGSSKQFLRCFFDVVSNAWRQQQCVTDAKLPAQCGQLDVECICSSNEWLSNLSCCISDNCPAKDQAGKGIELKRFGSEG